MAGQPQLLSNPTMLLKYCTTVRVTTLQHLTKPLKPQYLKLTSESKQNTNQQEHPSPINPRGQNKNKHNGIQCHAATDIW